MKNFICVFIIAILAVISYYLINKPVRSTAEFNRNMLKTDPSTITAIEIQSPGMKIILAEESGNWKLKVENEHLAGQEYVDILIDFLGNISLSDIISDNPERFSKYGVDDTGTHFTVINSEGSEKIFIIGDDDRGRKNSFYRLHDGGKVYIGTIFPRHRLPDELEGWISDPNEVENAENSIIE